MAAITQAVGNDPPTQWTQAAAWRSLKNTRTIATFSDVLDIFELLEQILIHLPMRDLLLSERVCYKFMSTIRQSVKLQQALFCRPISFDGRMWAIQRGSKEHPISILEATDPRAEDIQFDAYTRLDASAVFTRQPLVFNPLLCFPGTLSGDLQPIVGREFTGSGGHVFFTQRRLTPESVAWSMFLTQPPPKEAKIIVQRKAGRLEVLLRTEDSCEITTRFLFGTEERVKGILFRYGVPVTANEKFRYRNDGLDRSTVFWADITKSL